MERFTQHFSGAKAHGLSLGQHDGCRDLVQSRGRADQPHESGVQVLAPDASGVSARFLRCHSPSNSRRT
jgi:hypothetical protein